MLIVNWTMNCCNYCNCADLCRTRQDVALDDRVSSCCGRTYYRNKPTVDRRHWASTKLQPWPSPNHKTLTELILSKLCSYSLNTKLSTGIHLKLYTNVTFCFSFWGLRPPDSYRDFFLGPHWGTSVSHTHWLGPLLEIVWIHPCELPAS